MPAILRKLHVLVGVNHAVMLAYRAEIYLWVLAHVLPFIMMGVWVKAASDPLNAGEFSMDPLQYKRYFLAVFAIRQFTAIWMIYEFEWHITEGRLSNYLLRPMQPIWYYVSAHLGEQLARAPFFVAFVAAFFCICPDVFFSGWDLRMVLLGFVVIYLVFALRFALQYCFAMGAFWFERAGSLDSLSFVPYVFLSGAIIPLADIPSGLRNVLQWTPFPYMISFPARILTNQADAAEILRGLGAMAIWFVLLASLGAFLWRRGIRKYAGQGA